MLTEVQETSIAPLFGSDVGGGPSAGDKIAISGVMLG
jgi:hypothetical protein